MSFCVIFFNAWINTHSVLVFIIWCRVETGINFLFVVLLCFGWDYPPYCFVMFVLTKPSRHVALLRLGWSFTSLLFCCAWNKLSCDVEWGYPLPAYCPIVPGIWTGFAVTFFSCSHSFLVLAFALLPLVLLPALLLLQPDTRRGIQACSWWSVLV